MKRVSFKVAKAIQEAGYQQDIEFWECIEDNTCWYYPDGKLEKKGNIPEYIDISKLTFAPHLMDVWFWLWEEKNIKICVEPKTPLNGNSLNIDVYISAPFYALPHSMMKFYNHPDEAIIDAIEYLVDNDLIK